MTTKTNDIFETQALRCLGGRSKRNRTDLRQLPHRVIDRGRRMTQARLYRTEDVLKLRQSHFAQWSEEMEQLKKVIF